jgi:transposase
MKYRRPPAPTKIGPYEVVLRDALAADARRTRRERRTARKLYAQLQAQGFPGSYGRITEFIRAWRTEQGAVSARAAYVLLSVAWGEAFQFDRSEEGLVIGGVWRKVQLARMKLCASRAFWLVGYPRQGHEMLFDAHTRCLTGLGGVAGRGIYDNMKTAVDRTPRKDPAGVNARFAAMAAHYLFEPDFCNVASCGEKGRVEKGVQHARRRIWQDAQQERFGSFAELNAWLATQCLAGWDAPHPELPGMTIRAAWEQERAQLMPMPTPFDGYVEVRKPGALRNGAPFADLPDPLQRLRRALLRHEGGARSWPGC